jgi:hypothetical protein
MAGEEKHADLVERADQVTPATESDGRRIYFFDLEGG